MNKKMLNAKEAWKMNQVVSALNNEEAYFESGWLNVWPDESTFEECLEYFGDDESIKELEELYLSVFKAYYKDGIYNPYSVGPDALEYAQETLKKLEIKGEFKEKKPKSWYVEKVVEPAQKPIDTVSSKEVVKEAVAKEPENLKALIAKLNEPVKFEDEVFEPIFNFSLVKEHNNWFLYDKNEQYNINYEENNLCFYHDMADEFGVKIPDCVDNITSQLLKAVKKDFGPDSYIEWEDNARMIIVIDSDIKESKIVTVNEELSFKLTPEMFKKFDNSNVYFDTAKDKNGKDFLIVDGWEDVKKIQKIVKPDFKPKDEYDTSVLDNIKDTNWGFSDEWAKCEECEVLIRTSPDSYFFVPDYWINEGQILCGDCVRKNHAEEYAESLINNEKVANTILTDVELKNINFEVFKVDFESGWHGRKDSPKEILNNALKEKPNGKFLFSILGNSQFATQFELWVKKDTTEDSEDNLEESKKSFNKVNRDKLIQALKKAGFEGYYGAVQVGDEEDQYSYMMNGELDYIVILAPGDKNVDGDIMNDYMVENPESDDEECQHHFKTIDLVIEYLKSIGGNLEESKKSELEYLNSSLKELKLTFADLKDDANYKKVKKHIETKHGKKAFDEVYTDLQRYINKHGEYKLKESKQLNEMIIDLILDRKDGIDYDPAEFYDDARQYGEVADEITGALDAGTEEDVKKALCKYIKDNDYNLSICDYINSVSWLGDYVDEELIEPKEGGKVSVYQFPNSIKNFLPEFKRLCDEFELKFLGKGKVSNTKEEDESDFFVEGPIEKLQAIAKELDYELHPDYLCPADEFAYEEILIESNESLTKNTIKESVDKNFSEEEANKFVKELTQKFFDEGEYFDIWSSSGSIEAQIEWGDWKHQHLFFKSRIQKYFDDLNIAIDIKSKTTEEDGTDAYSASYIIKKQS